MRADARNLHCVRRVGRPPRNISRALKFQRGTRTCRMSRDISRSVQAVYCVRLHLLPHNDYTGNGVRVFAAEDVDDAGIPSLGSIGCRMAHDPRHFRALFMQSVVWRDCIRCICSILRPVCAALGSHRSMGQYDSLWVDCGVACVERTALHRSRPRPRPFGPLGLDHSVSLLGLRAGRRRDVAR